MIKLKFDKLYQTERYGELCSVAVPFPKGTLFDVSKIIILQEGIVFPSQAKVTSYWEDKSIRWVFVRFLADLPTGLSTEYYLSYEGVITEGYLGSKKISCEKDGEGYTVDTGVLRFTMEPGKYGGFKEGNAYGMKYFTGNFYGPILTDEMGYSSELSIESWKVIEFGAVCVILGGDGRHQIGKNDYRVRMRVTAYADSPCLEFSYRLFNTSHEELKIKSLIFGYRSPGNAVRTCAAISNYKTQFDVGEHGEAVEQSVDARLLLYEANEHIGEVFHGSMFADCTTERGGVCATIYQPHQNFPKAVYADENSLLVKLVPEDSRGVIMQSGMSREQRFLLQFHDRGTDLKELAYDSLVYQMPDRPILEPDVYKEAGVFHDVFLDEKRAFAEIGLLHKADAHARCYGMMNWGDSPDKDYTSQGRGNGELVWTNNEYDFPHACALQYVRTGTRRFLDYVLVAGRHWIDVDICHYSDDPLLFGGQWEHAPYHTANSKIVCSHQWVEGLLDYYHFTGDEEAYQTAIGIGKNILRLLDTPMFQRKGEINARETGWALRSMVALYKETYEERWISKCSWIVGHFEEWEKEYGHWMSPYTDNTAVRVVFMISIAVGSLMRYYRIRPKDEIKNMILRAVNDLIESCYEKDCGMFIYKELPSLAYFDSNPIVLEALTIAYELTGDAEYLTYGKQTFQMLLKDTNSHLEGVKRIVGDALIGQGTGTKDFAQGFLPLVSYYKAAVLNKLI